MKEVKLSIIIPLYNGKLFIKETVDEILKIECEKEILIIDDGSKDGSFEYCQQLWNMNPEVKLFTKKNSGIVDTRNYGMSKAKGKYLFFSDQDDIIYPKVVESAIRESDNMNLEGVIWSTVRLDRDGTLLPCDTVWKNQIICMKDIRNVLLPNMLINTSNEFVSYLGHVWSGIYSRNIIETKQIKFKRFIDIEDDYLFVFDFLRHTSKIGFIKEVGYAWRINQKSETYRQKYIRNILDKYHNFYDYLEKSLEDVNLTKSYKNTFERYNIQNTAVMAIENSFTYLNHSKEDKNAIKYFYKKHKSCFKKNSVFKYEKRRKRIYWCLQHELFILAKYYIFIDSIYRKSKNNVNEKKMIF